MIASLLALAILGFSPAGNALILPLEDRFPLWDDLHGAPDGMVVLGGSISPEVSKARRQVALDEAAERITAAVTLAHLYPKAQDRVLRRQRRSDLSRGD